MATEALQVPVGFEMEVVAIVKLENQELWERYNKTIDRYWYMFINFFTSAKRSINPQQSLAAAKRGQFGFTREGGPQLDHPPPKQIDPQRYMRPLHHT